MTPDGDSVKDEIHALTPHAPGSSGVGCSYVRSPAIGSLVCLNAVSLDLVCLSERRAKPQAVLP